MNKAEFVEKLYERRSDDIRTKAAAERIASDVFEIIAEGVAKNGSARFAGFGTFVIVKRAARTGTDPQTKAKIKIKAKNVIKFKPAQALKDLAAKSKAAN